MPKKAGTEAVMSLHNIPANTDIDRLTRLVKKHLREPSNVLYGNGLTRPPTALEYAPDLTAQEIASLSLIFTVSNGSAYIELSPADQQVIEDNKALLITFLGLASPTNAQTAAALKNLIRIVRAVVKA